jgi:hypothetical protein
MTMTKVTGPHGPGQFRGPINPATLPQSGIASAPIVPPYLGNVGMPTPGNFAVNSGQLASPVRGSRTVNPQLLAAMLAAYKSQGAM